MQTRIVVALLALLVSPVLVAAQHEGTDRFGGSWQGVLRPGVDLRLGLELVREDGGGYAGTLISIDQGGARIPMSVRIEGDSIHGDLPSIGGRLRGQLRADGDSIDGIWTQGPGSLPIVFGRAAQIEQARRPQEPTGAVPYRSEEVSFPSAAAGVRLAGTLTLPEGPGPHPAVVLVSGSGPQDRDEAIAGHRPFLVLADHLTRAGIAVLRFDDRGVGSSTGDFATATTPDFAEDAVGAVRWLRSRPEISGGKVGVVGHSEGGLVAPMVAAREPATAFLVLLAAPGIPGDSILFLQGELIGRANGAPERVLQAMRTAQRGAYAALREEGDREALRRRLLEISEAAGADLSEGERATAGLTAAGVESMLPMVTSAWFRGFIAYDPRPALRAVRVPVLALNGSLDLQVPAGPNLSAIQTELTAGGNADVTTRELPGLNHLFQRATTGSPSEYAAIEETINPVALEAISSWIRDRFGPGRK